MMKASKMFHLDRHTIHYFLWQGFTILSSTAYWWSISFKPLQRAASVAATKDLFTPTDENYNKIFSKYSINTKLSLELGSIIECIYKDTDATTTQICVNTATVKYSIVLLCEVASFGTAPSYITKPSCFALGTLTSNLYKASFKNESLQFSDFVFTSIATAARVSEHFLPKYLAEYGVPFDFSFYITTFFEGAFSLLYKQLKSDYECNDRLVENSNLPHTDLENKTFTDRSVCIADPLPKTAEIEPYIQKPDYTTSNNNTCNLEFCYAF